MTQQPVAGRKQNNIRLTVGEHSYEKQVSHVEFAPAAGQEWQGGTPDAKLVDSDYVCNITAIQAWDQPASFVRWCFEHQGEQADVEYQPHADDPLFILYSTITIPAINIGGKVNQKNESVLACPATAPTTTVPAP